MTHHRRPSPQPARTRPDPVRRHLLRRPPGYDLAIGFVIVVITFLSLLDGIADAPLHMDESNWISRAHYLSDLRDPDAETWDADSFMMRAQPRLGSLWAGLALVVQGRDLATNAFWRWGGTYEENLAEGRIPDPADLVAVRRANALLVALTTALLFATVAAFSGRVGGLVAAIGFASHPFVRDAGQRAMSDALFIFLLMVAGAAAWKLASRPRWMWSVVLGLAIGLAGATKLSPIFLAIPVLVLGVTSLVAPLTVRGREWRAGAGLWMKTLPILPLAVVGFGMFDPWLWTAPIDHGIRLFRTRSVEMQQQADRHAERHVTGFADSLGHSWQMIGGGSLVREAFIVIGLLGLGIAVRSAWRQGPWSPTAFLLAILGVEAAIILSTIKVAFDRYYLPVILLLALTAGVAAGAAARKLGSGDERSPQPRMTSPIDAMRADSI